MKLLVSVVDAGEAREAAAAGADIVDVKNPAEGSLGAPSPAVIAAVRAAVPAELPVSAAIGDMPNLPGTAALAALGAARSGATFVKVGLWGVSTEADAVELLRAVVDGVPGAVVVAAAYADARRVPHAPLSPELLPRVARAAGVGVCLLDTAVKDGRGLLDWLSPDALTSFVAEAHAAGLQVALAGALRAEDLPVVRDTGRRHRRRPLGRLPRRPALGAPRRGARPRPGRATPAAGDSMSSSGVQAVRDLARALLARGSRHGVAPDRRPPRSPAPGGRRGCSLLGSVSIRQRRPKPTCQRSSRSTRSMPSRTPGRAPSSRSSSSACCPASKTTPSSSMW